jgi:hypothetical protein
MKGAILAILAAAMGAAGLAGGLYYTWMLDPLAPHDVPPDSLFIEDKFTYLTLIGDVYGCEGDLARATDRLAELDVAADGMVLADLVEQYLDRGGRPEDVRNLAQLAKDLGASGGVLLVFGSAPSPSPVSSPSPPVARPASSATPSPTVTPAPTFRLVEQTALCAGAGQPGQIAVRVQDAEGKDLPGIEIVVSWATGQDRFFTGLRPDQGLGYADFDMRPEIEYDVALADFRGDVAEGIISDVDAGVCPTGTVALDWRLVFQQAP